VEGAKPLIAKFQMSIKDAGYRYRDWVKKQCYVPKDFDIAGNLEKIKGIWVPVWLFEVSAESAWHGTVSHTESRSRTRYNYIEKRDEHYEEDEEVWEPVSSTHYGNYLIPVSASRVIAQKEIDSLKFKQLDLKSYDESYLDGWQVHATDLNKTEASEICNELIKNLEWKACTRQVERLNGCSTKLTYKTSNFAILPMFVLSYTYKDNLYRNLINGVTGEVYGDMPINRVQKALVTILYVVVALAVLFIIFGILGSR
jgi:hypothetical protein